MSGAESGLDTSFKARHRMRCLWTSKSWMVTDEPTNIPCAGYTGGDNRVGGRMEILFRSEFNRRQPHEFFLL